MTRVVCFLCSNPHLATIPQYVPRKSQNELLQMSGADPSLKGKMSISLSHTTALTCKLAKIVKRSKKIHVPKYRPSVAGQSPASPSSESDSSDYDSDSDYDSEPEPEKFPLPGNRPQDAIGATRYDSAKAVFLPRNVYVENEALRLGLKNFWNLIKTIRERWNKDSEAVKEAAEAKKDSELPMLRDRVKNQRDMMKVALDTAIEFGHQDLIRAYVFPRLLNSPLTLMCTPVSIENDAGCIPVDEWRLSRRDGRVCCPKAREQIISGPRLLPPFSKQIATCEPNVVRLCVRKSLWLSLGSQNAAHDEVLSTVAFSLEEGAEHDNSDHTLLRPQNHFTLPQKSP